MPIGLIANVILIPALMVGLGILLRRVAVRVVPISLLRFWIYPGTAIHELSHAGACFLVFAPVEHVVLFRADGSGEVRHGPSKIGKLGDMIIGMAPVGGGLLALWLLNLVLDNPLHWGGAVKGNAADSMMFIPLLFLLAGEGLINTVTTVDVTDWRMWLMLYMSVSIALSLMPSGQDFKNSAAGIGVVIAGVVVWVLVSWFMDAGSSGAVGAFLTWLLGFGYVVLYCYALGFAVLLLLAGIGWLLGSFRGGK